MNHECSHLDAYLADDLPSEQVLDFERHLPECDACRAAIDEQRWIDDLLQSPARLQLENVSGELVHSVVSSGASASQHRRHVRLAACGFAAAASLLIAFGWLELNRQAISRVERNADRADIADGPRVQVAAAPRATFVGGADVIAVPIKSHHPDVTIVRIYPTYRPPYEGQTAASKIGAASDLSWPNYSNGG